MINLRWPILTSFLQFSQFSHNYFPCEGTSAQATRDFRTNSFLARAHTFNYLSRIAITALSQANSIHVRFFFHKSQLSFKQIWFTLASIFHEYSSLLTFLSESPLSLKPFRFTNLFRFRRSFTNNQALSLQSLDGDLSRTLRWQLFFYRRRSFTFNSIPFDTLDRFFLVLRLASPYGFFKEC